MAREFAPSVLIARRATYDHVADALVEAACCPVIGEVNAVPSIELERLTGTRLGKSEKRREARFFSSCMRLCCVTSEVQSQLVSIGVPAEKTTIVPNGVDTRLFAPSTSKDEEVRPFLTDARCVIGYCSSVNAIHDLATTVSAAMRVSELLHDVKFLFVGPTGEDLIKAGADTGLVESSVVTGYVPHARVPGLMAWMDIGVVALASEHLSPLKVMEFMAMGIPVAVAAQGSGLAPVLDAPAGFMVGREDADGLARALAVLTSDSERRLLLGRSGLKWVREYATWQMVAARMLSGL
jgi:glycosyltransferase involved in cell wall biosynthesis